MIRCEFKKFTLIKFTSFTVIHDKIINLYLYLHFVLILVKKRSPKMQKKCIIMKKIVHRVQ